MSEYAGNVWKCPLCKNEIRQHYIENCPRCGAYVVQVHGKTPEGTGLTANERRREYSREYYRRTRKAKRTNKRKEV